MSHSLTAVAFAFVALCVSGCGTIQNLRSGEDMTPYGGLVKDSPGQMLLALDGPQRFHGSPLGIIIVAPIAAGEVCLTCIGDTLTLPVTCYVQAQRCRQEQTGHVSYGVAAPQAAAADRGSSNNVTGDNDAPGALAADDPAAWGSVAQKCLGSFSVQAENEEELKNTSEPAPR